jgi:hypothetical protein
VDDIVEFDPEDADELFSSKDETAQYFMLVKELQNPGSSKKDAWVSLYTARPKSDRAMYETGEVPAGVFFANNLSHVEGIAHDMGGRDLWKMTVNKKDLVQTLEGGIKYYQTVRPTKAKKVELLSAISGSAPKESLAQFLAKLYKDMTNSQTGLSEDAEVYLKHSALNLGQAARDLRYLFDYPRETSRMRSLSMRLKSLANNLKYTALPPQWHHTAEDLLDMEKATVAQWLKHGYAPWDHPVEGIDNSDYVPDMKPGEDLKASAPDKYSHISFSPPQGVRSAAARGLALRKEHGRGGTAVGVARARDLSNGTTISPSTAKRMKAYFDRHQVDKKGKGFSPGEDGYPSAGKIAWDLWGSDAGYAWAKKLVRQMEVADK